ncbi:MAG: hypothetical protein C0410_01520 [Anaerolinea sp.]|nr:hypothetical protein [Anaerolinea sp.]
MGDFLLSTVQPSILKTILPKENSTSGLSSRLTSVISNNKVKGSDRTEISGLSSFALSMRFAELNYANSSSVMMYRSNDNSLALKASRSVNINLKMEKIQFDLTLSAESLGLDASAFGNKLEPLILKLQYTQTELMISNDIQIKQHKTLRSPQEIIQDLVKGLTTAMQDPDKRKIIYTLDDEAVQALVQSDPKIAKLFGELVMIMNAVNLMKDQSHGNQDYTIMLSGKGKPYTEVSEDVDIKGFAKEYSINITVLPPQTKSTNQVEAATS